MKRAIWTLVALALLIGGVGQAKAGTITNGGFETGDLTGWTANPSYLVSVVTSYSTFTPVDGSYFALLSAGAGANTYTTLSQDFSADAGQTISGSAFFQANDYLPFNDDGYVKIIQNGQVLFSSDVATVGDYGNTPWTSFSYTFSSSGTYTIEAGVRNLLDNAFSSALGLDNVQLSSAVPEPTSLTLLTLGALGLTGYGWKRRKQTVAA